MGRAIAAGASANSAKLTKTEDVHAAVRRFLEEARKEDPTAGLDALWLSLQQHKSTDEEKAEWKKKVMDKLVREESIKHKHWRHLPGDMKEWALGVAKTEFEALLDQIHSTPPALDKEDRLRKIEDV